MGSYIVYNDDSTVMMDNILADKLNILAVDGGDVLKELHKHGVKFYEVYKLTFDPEKYELTEYLEVGPDKKVVL